MVFLVSGKLVYEARSIRERKNPIAKCKNVVRFVAVFFRQIRVPARDTKMGSYKKAPPALPSCATRQR
ncbi:MAG: hypothetical protein WA904_01055 [Polaromonas sp.]